MIEKKYVASAGVEEYRENALTIVKEPTQTAEVTIKYEEPALFKINTVNVRMILLELKDLMIDVGVPPQKVETFFTQVKTVTGKVSFILESEGLGVYAITLPPGFTPKNVKLENAGEGSTWRYTDNTLLLLINFTSPVTVVIELETVASIILGFTGSLMMLSLMIAFIKLMFHKLKLEAG